MGAEGAYRPGKLAFYDNLSLTLFLQVTGNTFVLGKKKKKEKNKPQVVLDSSSCCLFQPCSLRVHPSPKGQPAPPSPRLLLAFLSPLVTSFSFSPPCFCSSFGRQFS